MVWIGVILLMSSILTKKRKIRMLLRLLSALCIIVVAVSCIVSFLGGGLLPIPIILIIGIVGTICTIVAGGLN